MTDAVTISGHAHGVPLHLNFNPADTLHIIRQIDAAINSDKLSGDHLIRVTGSDTLAGIHGNDTIDATSAKKVFVDGKDAHFTFVGGAGSATVLGGTGSETVFGGHGRTLAYGGTDGHNVLFAGTGAATLVGGGHGDQLFAEGHKAQKLIAGNGNETLSAALSTGNVTLVAGSGKDVLVGGKGHDVFEFIQGQSGGKDLILNFSSNDKVALIGYELDEVSIALATAVTHHGSVSITLSDNTKITFSGVANLKSSNFI